MDKRQAIWKLPHRLFSVFYKLKSEWCGFWSNALFNGKGNPNNDEHGKHIQIVTKSEAEILGFTLDETWTGIHRIHIFDE